MTAGQYAVGLLVLAGMLVPATVTALSVRRVLLPGWPRPPAAVAEAVVAIGTLVLVGELLGAVGAFRRAPMVVALVVIAAAAALGARRLGPRGVAAPPPPAPRPGTAPVLVAALAVAVVLVPWLQYALSAFHDGMREFDTVTYHMPFAARFVQDASTTGLHYDGNAPVSFYPANSELVHALGILSFHRDLLSPLLNLAWLALALLAAWCIGRPTGTGPATTTAVAVVASLQVMVSSQAGTAKNDMMALALLLSAAALVTTAPRSRAAVAIAALAGGLAVGTRLNLWAPVLVLAAVALIGTRRAARPAVAGWLVLGGLAGGGFWYARNLAQVGNPLPWIGVRLGGLLTLHSTSKPADCGTRSVAHYAARPGFVRAHLVPQLTESFGGRWWLVLALAAAGVAAGLAARGAPAARGLALVALLSGVAYLFTPATAGGVDARCFAFNTRFAAPAVALGLIALPLALQRRRMPPLGAVLALGVAILVDVHVPLKAAPLAGSALLLGAAAAIVAARRRGLPPAAFGVGVVCVAVVAVLAGWREQRIYLRERYSKPHLLEPVEPIATALRGVGAARVAVTGFVETYPLYGADLSARIELPARRSDARFVPAASCRSWTAALARGHFDYAVTARQGLRDAPAATWTRRIPGARAILVSPPGFTRRGAPWRWQLFRLDPARRAASCS